MKNLSGKVSENAELREEVEELRERLDRHEELLKQIFDPSDLPTPGEFENWITSEEATRSFRGKHIAYIEGEGVITSADTLIELVEAIEKQGNPTGVIIGFVPAPAIPV